MASVLLLILLALAAQGQLSFLNNCEIANLSSSSCLTCKSGYSLVGSQCLAIVAPQTNIFGSNQLTLSNLFSNVPNQNQRGSSLIYTNNNFGSSASTNNNQVFIPGYVQPGASSITNQNFGINTNTDSAQIQNAYLQSLLSYLASQNNQQGQNTQSNPSTSSNSAISPANQDPNCKAKTNVSNLCIECYQSYYYNVTLGKCLTINPLCKNYTQQNQCTTCFEGYSLSNGNCIVSPTYKAPQPGDENCKIKTQANPPGCLQCYPSFYFNSSEGKCVLANPLCKNVTNLNKCTSCYPGYTLDVAQGNCFISNTSSNSSATTSSSTTASNNDQNAAILALLSQYFGSSSISGNTGNSIRQIGNYQVVFNSQGQVVNVYQLNNANQAATTTQGGGVDPQCTRYVNNVCQGCNFGYYLSLQGCMSIDPNCLFWSSNSCTQCGQGYQILNGRCSLSSAATVFTPSSSTSSQSSCFFRQVFVNGSCVQVNDSCKTWDEKGQCTSCYGGYTLGAGQCSVRAR